MLAMFAGAGSRMRCDSAPGPGMVRRPIRAVWVQGAVNFDGKADHAIRKLVDLHLRALHVLRGYSLSVSGAGCRSGA